MKRFKRVFRIAVDLGNLNLKIALPALCSLALGTVLAARAQESPRQQQPSSAPTAQAPENGAAASSGSEAPVVSEKPKGKPFRSPQAAAAAFRNAARHDNTEELLAILGPDGKDLIHWSDERTDEADDQRMWFVAKYDQMHRLVREPDHTVALYVGAENWPVPIPIVEYKGLWYFGTDLGKQEVLYRRVGRNEIEALDVCRALVDAEKEYSGIAHTFTAKFESTPGAHDGLHWKGQDANGRSPVGPLLAAAGVTDAASVEQGQPFHGYFYRILLESSGGNGAGRFVVLAFPAAYRSSGVMTFLMNENGMASEKDLGPGTSQAALQLNSGKPDDTWKKVE
jgi:hypothetical protein